MLRKLFAIEITMLRGFGIAALIAAGFTTTATAAEADPYTMADNTWITLSGEVESVDRDSFMLDYGDGHILVEDVGRNEFTVDAGMKNLRVDVRDMPFDPLDEEGYLKIDVGDRVRVSGEMDNQVFEGRELVADTVIVLNR